MSLRATQVLAVALLLAACGGPQINSDEAFCRRRAEDVPNVKDLLEKAAGSPAFARNNDEMIRAAVQDATVACLRSRGVLRGGGGVERQKPL